MHQRDSALSPRPFSREELDYLVRSQDKSPMDSRDGRSGGSPKVQGAADRNAIVDNLIEQSSNLAKENEVLRKYLLLQKENSGLKTLDIITNAMGMYDDKLNEFKMKLHSTAGQVIRLPDNNTGLGQQSIVPDHNKASFGSQRAQSPSYGASFPKVRFSELETSDEDSPAQTYGQSRGSDNKSIPYERLHDESDSGRYEANSSYGQSFRELDINDLRSSGSLTSDSEQEAARQFYLSKAKEAPVYVEPKPRKSPRSSSAPAKLSNRSPRQKSPGTPPRQKSPGTPILQPAMRFSMDSQQQYTRMSSPGRVDEYQSEIERKRRVEIESQYRSRSRSPVNKSALKSTTTSPNSTRFYDSLDTSDRQSYHMGYAEDSCDTDCDSSLGCKMVRALSPATGNGGTSFRCPSPVYVNAAKHGEADFLTVIKSTNTDYLRSKSPTGQKKSVAFSSDTSTSRGPGENEASIKHQSPRFDPSNGPSYGNGSARSPKSPRSRPVNESVEYGMFGKDSTTRNAVHSSRDLSIRTSPYASNQSQIYGPPGTGSPMVNGDNQGDDSVWVNITTRAKVFNESPDNQRRANQENSQPPSYYNTIVDRQSEIDDKGIYRRTIVENQREGDDNVYYHTTVERQMDGDDNRSYRKTTINRQMDGDDKHVYRQSIVEKQKDGDTNKYQHTIVERQNEGDENRIYRKIFVGKQNDPDRNIYQHTTEERQNEGDDTRVYRKTTVEKRNEGDDNRVYRRTIVEKQKEGDHNRYHHSTVERQNEGIDTNMYRKSVVERQRDGEDKSVNRIITIERQNEGDENKVYRKTILERQREGDDDRVYCKTTLERQNEREDNKMYRKTVVERQREDDADVYHHSTVERKRVVTPPALVGFQPIGSPLLTSTQNNSYRSRERRPDDSGQRLSASPTVNKSFEAKVKHFSAIAEQQSPGNGRGYNSQSPGNGRGYNSQAPGNGRGFSTQSPGNGRGFTTQSPASQSNSRRSPFNTVGKASGPTEYVVPPTKIAASKDSIGDRREFDRSLVEAVFQSGLKSASSEKVKAVLFRPVDTLTGYIPPVTKQLADMVLGSNPCRRLVGEIAFQLDRRVMEFVFGPRRNSEGKKMQRSRYYGYSLVNIRQLIKKEASLIGRNIPERAERVEQELLRKLNNIITILEPMGYDFNLHPEFTQDVVNKYGLLKEAPDRNTLEGLGLSEPVVLRMILGRVIGHGSVLDNVLILLDSLCYLAHSDRTPLFMW